jgi:hypothetical protein
MSEHPHIIQLAYLKLPPSAAANDNLNSSLSRDELYYMRVRLADALEAHPPGNLSRDAMLDVFEADRIKDAISFEWQFLEQIGIFPGMGETAFENAITTADDSKGFRLRIKLWEAFRILVAEDGPDRSGWIIRCNDNDGNAAVKLRWREDIKAGWADKIVVTMDATFSNNLVEPYFKRPLEILPAGEVLMEHVNILQVVDKSFAASSVNWQHI